MIGTGSPFPPLERNGAKFKVDQTNNSYIFPGVGLGAIAVRASRVTDAMFMAAAKALAAASPARSNPDEQSAAAGHRRCGTCRSTVALAVALQAHKEGLTKGVSTDQIEGLIRSKVWTPHYVPYQRVKGSTARLGTGADAAASRHDRLKLTDQVGPRQGPSCRP